MENRKRQLIVLICFLAVFVCGICLMKTDTLAAPSQKSFWDVADINPVSNPATENWLTTLIAKQIVGSPKPTPSQLTQAQFDSIETLVIKTVPGSGKNPWEAPKELANLRNLKEIEFQALTTESVFNNTPDEMFEIPSLKKLKITYYKGNFPAKLCLATQIEELEILNGSGTLGSSKQTVIPQEFGNLVNLRRLNIQETMSNITFPESIGNLVNLQSVEISDGEGVIFPEELGKLQQLEIFNAANVVMDEFPGGLTNCRSLKELSLYGRNYAEIPEQISNLANLERLELLFLPTGCKIPESIGELSKLKYLSTYSVYYNDLDKEVGITQLPESIGNCTELEEINLTGASITSLPKSITKLKKLTKLDLSQCLNLKSLPADIGGMSALTQLDLEVVLPDIGQISVLPDSIVNLTNLTELKAGQQQLKTLPDKIGEMSGLTAIYVEGNQLTQLPDSIGQLKNLGILHAQRNNLTEIPGSIGNLSLGQLFLQGNQLTSLPKEISELEGSSWMGQVAIDLSNNKFKTVPDISLFKKATVASLDLSNCEIEDLGEWTGEDGSPGALNGFYAKQRVGVSVNLSGNRILNIPESWEGKVVPSSTVLKGQTTKVTAQYNSGTKKAVLTNPLQYHGGKLPIDKYTISGGGKYDYNTYTFTWDNAKPGDMYTITFDAKSIYNSQGEKLYQYSGTLYVSVGDGVQTGHTLKLTARNSKGEDLTSQWPKSFKSSYEVFPDETIRFKLPGIAGYTLASPIGDFVQGSGGNISAADGFVTISKITQNSEVVFHYAKGLHRIQVVPLEYGTGTDLTELAADPNYQFNYEVEENGSITIQAPLIKGYTIKGASQVTLNEVTSDRSVEFTYTRNPVEEKVNIIIQVKDADGRDLSALVDQDVTPLNREVTKGSSVRVEAPVIGGYKVQGDSFQEFNPITKDETVTFTYKEQLQVTIKVKDSAGKDLSNLVNQETTPLVIPVLKGDNVRVEAPVIGGYKVQGENFQVFNPITKDETVTFTYKEQLQVTIKVKDSAGKDLSNLVNQETTPLVIPVLKGDNVRVQAPVIDGYEVQGDNFQEFNPITKDEIVTFTYKEQLQVTIKVKDSAGKDLSNLVNQETTPLVIPVLKGDYVRVEAPVIDGYKVQGENFQVFNPIAQNETVTFTYKEQLQVTIKVKDSAGKDLSNLVNQETTPLVIPVLKGDNVRVEAPVIDGYKAQGDNFQEFNPITKDETVTFTYKEQLQVTIKVKDSAGKDLSNLVNQETTPLVIPVLKGDNVRVEAPVIGGYKVQGENFQEFNPITKNETVTFTYKEQLQVTIKVKDSAGKDLSNLVNQETTPLVIPVLKGDNVRVQAPVIDGYKVQGDNFQEFNPITKDEIVTFTYKEQLNVTIKVKDSTGKDLSNLVNQETTPLVIPVLKGDNVRVQAPVIDGYKVQGDSFKVFNPITKDETVTFTYKEQLQVTIKVKDSAGNDLSNLVNQETTPLVIPVLKGDNVRVEAPVIGGYKVQGENFQVINPITKDETVTFTYKEQLQVTIKVKDSAGKDLSNLVNQETTPLVIPVLKGDNVRVQAPVIDGYKVQGENFQVFNPITKNETVTFTYKEQLSVTIKVKDSAGKDLSNLVNQETTPLVISALKGDNVRVEAPVIDGYKVQGENFQEFNPITKDETVTFTYKEQLQVTIKVKDSAGKDLSNLVNQETTPLVIPVLKGDNVRVQAPVIDGYKVQGENFQEFNPITKDETVTFTYKEQLQVTIKVKDSAGKDLSNLVNQETTPLVIPALKGDNVRVQAPVIDGYKVQGNNFQEFNPITKNETVTFTYKEQLSVTIKVKDSAGNDLSNLVNQETTPLIVPALKGDNVRVQAPVIDGYKVQGNNFQEFNPITKDETVTFTYKEQLQVTIKVKDSAGNDLSDLVNQETTPLVISALKGDNVRVKAPVIDGYKVQGENFQEFNPIAKDETVEFIYQEEIKPIEKVMVTIHVNDTTGKDLSNLVDQNVNPLSLEVEKGSDITVTAPVIEGYKLQGKGNINFFPIQKDEIVEFIYEEEVKPAEKVTVTILPVDTEGNDLSSLVNTEDRPLVWEVEKGSNVKVEAPEIDGYVLQGESSKDFSPIKQDENIVFTYAKEVKPVEKVNIIIIPIDEQGRDLSSLVNQEETPLHQSVEKNSNVIVSAPVIEGYKIQGESFQEFKPIYQDETVVFEYKEAEKPVEKVNITILLKDESGNDLSSLIDQDIYPLARTAEKGSNVRIEYPEMEGYEIQGDKVKDFSPILQNEEITFIYRKEVKPVEKVFVTILVKNEQGRDLSSLVDQSVTPLVVEAEKGSEVRIEAPFIDGYVVTGEDVQLFYPIVRDETVEFIYREKEKPVEKVKIHILVKDENNKDLSGLVDQSVSPLEIEAVKGDSIKIYAPSIDGYNVNGQPYYVISPITGDQSVTFYYKQKVIPVEKVKIYVKVFDEYDHNISNLVDQSIYKMVYEIDKGSSIVINAPSIKGYEVISQSKIHLQNVRYEQSAAFCYRKVQEKPKNPKLVLKQDRAEIFVGDNLLLGQMVSVATDSTNQDLRYSLRYTVLPSFLINGQIFCSPIAGEFRVAITLPHAAGNVTKYLLVKVKDRPKPDYAKLTLKKSKVTIKVGKKLDLRTLISVAQDSNGKNIKDKVTFIADKKKMIKKNYFAASKTGTFKVTFKMPYQKGTMKKQLKVVVKPASPVLRLKKTEITVKSGETVNLNQYIKEALQYKGGKNAMKLVKCKVGSENLSENMKFKADKAGKYKVMYSLTNKYGITVKKSMYIIVKAKKQLPVLKLSTDNLSITPGKRVYLKDFIKTASDEKDGPNLKSKVICTLNGERLLGDTFYSYNTGSYTILYRLTNQAGQTAMAELVINVKPWRS
ncbi:leucine-rich repeat domain-containing protein [Robinsoniella sp. KNHs210]|uniref:leucine-rich repeat domain-containing protein n=1 Tax=Robinsoniella sp. KNHs210 TaxID=1469950 RepID=UPI00047F14AB|nr:hypothetical protein [Robinsoniella sp. KNHs210]